MYFIWEQIAFFHRYCSLGSGALHVQIEDLELFIWWLLLVVLLFLLLFTSTNKRQKKISISIINFYLWYNKNYTIYVPLCRLIFCQSWCSGCLILLAASREKRHIYDFYCGQFFLGAKKFWCEKPFFITTTVITFFFFLQKTTTEKNIQINAYFLFW